METTSKHEGEMSKDWNTTEQYIGMVRAGDTVSKEFFYYGTKRILTIEPSCGCTSTKTRGNVVVAKFKADPVPKILKDRGESQYSVNKNVKVTFDDGSDIKLYLKGTVYEDK